MKTMNAGAMFVMLAPILPFAWVAVIFAKPPWTTVRMVGLVTCLVSFVLLTWARANLGNSFSVTPQARALITRGVYAKVRHPVYVFGAGMIAGLAFYIPLHWLLLALIPIVPMQFLRARAEEKVLVEKFGNEYLKYKQSTWI